MAFMCNFREISSENESKTATGRLKSIFIGMHKKLLLNGNWIETLDGALILSPPLSFSVCRSLSLLPYCMNKICWLNLTNSGIRDYCCMLWAIRDHSTCSRVSCADERQTFFSLFTFLIKWHHNFISANNFLLNKRTWFKSNNCTQVTVAFFVVELFPKKVSHGNF